MTDHTALLSELDELSPVVYGHKARTALTKAAAAIRAQQERHKGLQQQYSWCKAERAELRERLKAAESERDEARAEVERLKAAIKKAPCKVDGMPCTWPCEHDATGPWGECWKHAALKPADDKPIMLSEALGAIEMRPPDDDEPEAQPCPECGGTVGGPKCTRVPKCKGTGKKPPCKLCGGEGFITKPGALGTPWEETCPRGCAVPEPKTCKCGGRQCLDDDGMCVVCGCLVPDSGEDG